ncbi:MAG TPA: DUF5916 domain-containing protein [Thermoanaerobaculia bacterium]|nr:DUF5916 domain-containing protein [Thermoanaerobaculia bacterium]
MTTQKFAVALIVLGLSVPASAQEQQKVPIKAKDYRIEATTEPVKIDGVLNEAAWTRAQPMEFDAETFPGDNVAPPARTVGFMTYDQKNLYVAFRAYEPRPKEIRAHLSDRDTAFNDDFVGVILDTFNDDRRAFEFLVNPLGVQMDLIQDDTNRNTDNSWDAIWSTAGQITPDGFIVEMAIPFTSIRFPRSESEQTWGVDMVRNYPRSTRHRLGLQGQDRNRNCSLCQSSRVTGFKGIAPGRDIELDPTITAQQTSTRNQFPGGDLTSGDADINAGLTARWGITPNLTLNAALNPDFSQIEADSVQLDINTQFALFFNEKRPFFLEGADFFEGPLQTVYTRTVADPGFGLKITGRLGDSTVGAYVAQDEVTNLLIPGPQGSSFASLDQKNISSAFRYRLNVGATSSVGAMLTTRDGDGYGNRVYGFDGNFRLTAKDTITGQIVGSDSDYPELVVSEYSQKSGGIKDIAGRIEYRHNSRNWNWGGRYEDIGTDFRADSGFIPQVGYRSETQESSTPAGARKERTGTRAGTRAAMSIARKSRTETCWSRRSKGSWQWPDRCSLKFRLSSEIATAGTTESLSMSSFFTGTANSGPRVTSSFVCSAPLRSDRFRKHPARTALSHWRRRPLEHRCPHEDRRRSLLRRSRCRRGTALCSKGHPTEGCVPVQHPNVRSGNPAVHRHFARSRPVPQPTSRFTREAAISPAAFLLQAEPTDRVLRRLLRDESRRRCGRSRC